MERRQPPPSGGAFAVLIGGAPGAGKTTLARSLGGMAIRPPGNRSVEDLAHEVCEITGLIPMQRSRTSWLGG